ncbi:hypothetical protein BST61_g6863 [Cercospora zeina]
MAATAPQHIDPALSAPAANTTTTTATTSPSAAAPPPPLRYEHHPPPPPQPFAQHPPGAHVAPYPAPSASNPYYSSYPTPQPPTPHAPSTAAASAASASNQASPAAGTPQYQQQLAQDGIDNSQLSDPNDATHPDDPKRPRACEACRGLKVRCDQDPHHPELPCRRCAKAGRQCIITAPSRKRQKKADSRVAELEKKLDHLTAVLLQQQQQGATVPYSPQYAPAPTADLQGRAYAPSAQQLPPYGSPEQPHDPPSMQPPAKRRRTDDHAIPSPALHAPASAAEQDARSHSEQDLSNRLQEHNRTFDGAAQAPNPPSASSASREFTNRINALVTPALGVQMFNRYVEKLAPHMPAVVFPLGTQAEQVSREKPLLYAAILSAASYGVLHPSFTDELGHEAIKEIANIVVVNGGKSIELIQAVQVLALWYKPPEHSQATNFYQIIHMAAIMCIELGLCRRPSMMKSRRGPGGPLPEYTPGPPPNHAVLTDSLEARRAYLGCYYLCASAAMVLRRPTLVHWTSYMEECVETLETSPDALPSDRLFCEHIKIQHICENVSVQFSMDDNGASVSITDPKVSYALNVMEHEIKDWSSKIPPQLKSHPSLKLFEHVASLYLHEIALHFNHNVEDFRVPFTEESLRSVNSTSDKLSQHQISALEACRHSAHGIIDCMLAFDAEAVMTMPTLIFFVRTIYAIVILIKMHVAVTTPGSEIAKVMTAEDVDVDRRLDGIRNIYINLSTAQDFQPHTKVVVIINVLQEWFTKYKENVAAQARGEAPPNPMHQQPGTCNGQTPLHLLAQTASDVKQEQRTQQPQTNGAPTWPMNASYPSDYLGQAQGQYPVQQQQPGNGYSAGHMGPYGMGNGGTEFDSGNPWLWGSNFQQAMDLSLADMNGVTGGGMDGLFFGPGLAPFDLAGDGSQMQ